jgi:hypothetical protein
MAGHGAGRLLASTGRHASAFAWMRAFRAALMTDSSLTRFAAARDDPPLLASTHQKSASSISCGTPLPCPYSMPNWACARTLPRSAARRVQKAALPKSAGIPISPLYRTPRLASASRLPCAAAVLAALQRGLDIARDPDPGAVVEAG